MRPSILAFLLAVLAAAAPPEARAAGESLALRVERFRLDPSSQQADGYLAFVNLHVPQPVDLSSVTLAAPDGSLLLDAGEPAPGLDGLAPYAHERVLAFSGADLFLRSFGLAGGVPCPLPDGVYTATQENPEVFAETTLGGDFPPFPDVLSPAPDDEVPTSFSIQVDFPEGPIPDATRLLVVESRKGAFALPPKFTLTLPGAVGTIALPEGVLEPREHVFLVVTSIVGSKGSATVVPVTVEASDGVVASVATASLTVEKKAAKTKSKLFVRKGKFPKQLLDGGGADEIEMRLGSLEPLVLPLAKVENGLLKVKHPDHPQIRFVKIDFTKGRYKVRGRLEDADRLGTDEDVVLTLR